MKDMEELVLLREFYSRWLNFHNTKGEKTKGRPATAVREKQEEAIQRLLEAHQAIQQFQKSNLDQNSDKNRELQAFRKSWDV